MKLTSLLIFLILVIGSSRAGVFDSRYPSARATGMGEAFVAVANDVWAAYYNPAGLAQVQSYRFASAMQKPFNRSFFSNAFLGGAMPLPKSFGTLAFSFENYGVSYGGVDLSSENTATLSHAFYLLNDIHSALSFGYNLRYYNWKLANSVDGLELGSAGTFGLDIGMQASLYQRTYVGVYVYNINAPTLGVETKHDLPQRIVAGAAYRPVSGLITSVAFDKTLGYDVQMQAGFEFMPVKWLSLRLGASTDPNRFSAGIGLNYLGLRFDYSFLSHPVLPETHKFGISYQLN